MRSRLSTAFLLLLSTIFLAGGLPAQQVRAVSAQVTVAQPDQTTHRQAVPQPRKPQVGTDAGAHHGFGGLAVPAPRQDAARPARGGACPAADADAPSSDRQRANPARAPPHSTGV